MAHNIFHTGFDFIKDKTTDLVDNVKDFGTDLYVDYKVDQYVDSFTDEFKGPTTITPEMAAEGWKPGLDGVPYNSKLNEKFEPGGIFYDPDVDKNTAIANAVASGAVSSAEAGTEEGSPFLSQDLRQRTPSGTIYNPSMDDYNNASLFEYTGPGGLENYTYGEGLPTDYGIYGTPPGPNLYYEGQYGEGFVEPGVADPAIELPAVTMPDGVPQIPSSNASNKASNKNKDLTYAETIAAMGIAPGDAPSTLFPSPGNTANNNSIYSSGMNSNLLNSYINEPQGDSNYVNSGMTMPSSYINEPQGDSNYVNSGMTASPSYIDESAIGNSQQFFPSEQANFETANNIYNPPSNNVTRNPNEETQPYRGIYVDPRTVPEINLPETNVTYPPSFPAGYGDGDNMSLLTTTDEPYDSSLIMSAPMTVEEQAMGTNPELFEEDEEIVISTPSGDLTQSDLDAMLQNGITMDFNTNSSNEQPIIPKQYGLDEAVIDGYKYITNLFSGDEPSAEEVAASVTEEPSIWNSVMEVIAGTAGMGFPGPGESEPVVAQTEPVVPAIQPSQDMYQYDGAYASNAGSNAAIDAVIANSMAQDQAVAQASQAAYTGPSIFTQPAAPAPVYAAPGGAPGYTSYGPPNMQRIGGRYGL